MKKKSIAIVLALVLLVCCAVGGVLAWLTDTTDSVVNTFTVGNVDITLAESENLNLKMVPGQPIFKDPKVTVVGGSEACWLFVKVQESDNLDRYIEYTVDSTVWTALPGVENVYYCEVSANTDDQIFDVLTGNQVTVNNNVTKEMMDNLKDNPLPTLTFTAYACQKAGVTSAADAWAKINPAPAP